MTALSQGGPTCLGEDTLAAFADGQIEGHEHGTIEKHLADCRDCRVVLARTAGGSESGADTRHARSGDTTAPRSVPSGTRVGRYIVEGLVGRGAMGTVYAARDPDLDRRVAVKLLRADGLSDAALSQMRARLLREAQAMARLSHPEVITVYDVGAFGDQLFVAMEFVEGETLRQWRATRHRGHAEILAAYERAGSGLAAAHEAGLVHRDFKPDNVLVGRDGRVRVTDFGLARSVDGADSAPARPADDDRSGERGLLVTLTRTGTLLGTPAYMAPEQLHGTMADARSDVFSFCVALYEALYSERPFAGPTILSLQAAIEAGAVRAGPVMSRVPGWVRAVLLRGLRAAPAERFASMRELLDALRAEHAVSQRRDRRAVAVALGILGIAGVAWVAVPRASHLRRESVESSAPVGSNRDSVATPLPPGASAIVPWSFVVGTTGSALPPAAPGSAFRIRVEEPPKPPLVHAAIRGSPAPSAAVRASPERAPSVGNNGAFILE